MTSTGSTSVNLNARIDGRVNDGKFILLGNVAEVTDTKKHVVATLHRSYVNVMQPGPLHGQR